MPALLFSTIYCTYFFFKYIVVYKKKNGKKQKPIPAKQEIKFVLEHINMNVILFVDNSKKEIINQPMRNVLQHDKAERKRKIGRTKWCRVYSRWIPFFIYSYYYLTHMKS